MTLAELKRLVDRAFEMVSTEATVYFVDHNNDDEKTEVGNVDLWTSLSGDEKAEVLLSE